VTSSSCSWRAIPHPRWRCRRWRPVLPIPVLGDFEPGAKLAAERSRSGRVGVIGTLGTIRSGAYRRALEAARSGVTVVDKACPLFVPLAEEGWVTEKCLPECPELPRGLCGKRHRYAGPRLHPLSGSSRRDRAGRRSGVALRGFGGGELRGGRRPALVPGAARNRSRGTRPSVLRHRCTRRTCRVGERFLGHSIRSAEQVDIA